MVGLLALSGNKALAVISHGESVRMLRPIAKLCLIVSCMEQLPLADTFTLRRLNSIIPRINRRCFACAYLGCVSLVRSLVSADGCLTSQLLSRRIAAGICLSSLRLGIGALNDNAVSHWLAVSYVALRV